MQWILLNLSLFLSLILSLSLHIIVYKWQTKVKAVFMCKQEISTYDVIRGIITHTHASAGQRVRNDTEINLYLSSNEHSNVTFRLHNLLIDSTRFSVHVVIIIM